MKDKFSKFINLQGKYLTSLLFVLLLGIGQMWAADPDLALGTDEQLSSSFLGEYSTQGITLSSSASFSSGAVQLGNTPSSYDQHYLEVLSSNAEIDKVSFLISGNGSNKSIQAPVFAWAETATGNTADTYVLLDAVVVTANSYAAAQWFEYDLSGANVKCARIYRTTKNISSTDPAYTGSSTALGSGQTIKIYGIKVWLKSSGGCSAPTGLDITPSKSAYTEGDDISLVASGTGIGTGATYAWYKGDSWDDASAGSSLGSSATLTINNCSTSDAGTYWCEISNGTGCAAHVSEAVTVNAAESVCPSGLTISGTQAYTEGDKIELTAALSAGNGTITYQWYKGSVASGNAISGATAAKLEISNCETTDAGDYFCVASKEDCSDAVNAEAYTITVAEAAPLVACATLTPATSGDAPAANDAITLQAGSTGGSIKALTTNLSYTANGLLFGSSSSTKAEVTLNNLMQVGTIITATIYNDNNDKNRGLNLLNSNGTSKATWTKNMIGDHVETYTVVEGDGLAGSNVFQLQRNNNAYLKSISVSNCGAELHALTSAVSVEGKATITLSKSLIAEGGTATATYSAIDAAYEFDEWQISGATIDEAKANPVTITMGSTDATITLKLKEAGTKYAVHFDSKGGSAVADQLVEAGGHASVPAAPTKFKYTFGGWSETDGGAAADLASVVINAEKTFYAIWTPKVCPTSGEIYSFVSDGTKAPASNTYCPASGVKGVVDIAAYANVSGGLAQAVHTTTSNNPAQIQTSTSAVKLSHADGYFRALLECPLQEGDTIKFEKSNKVKIAFDSLRTEVVEIASGTNNYIVPAGYASEDTIMVYYNGSSVNLTALRVIRPAKYAVTFNMHGHGDAVDPQYILEGGKVTEPATASITGWDFGGWFKESTYDNEWDFDNDVVGTSAIELHAKWTEHAVSSDATLKDLTVNGVTVAGFDPATEEYNVVLEMGTTTTPEVAGVPNDDNYSDLVYMQTSDPTDDVTITVTAEDGSTSKTYTIHFSIATSKDIQLVFKTGTTPCVGSASTATQILSNNAAVSTYINQITFTNVEGAGDDGAEGSSLNVGKKAGNMFTLSAKAGYAFQAMNFLAKIQDATCEYSINGGDWTELASTSTSADECYAPFTSGTVHEFRLRSTGTSGVWIRNMQLTMIEACTPITLAWGEEPVEFEVGKAGYAIAATANNSGTITYGSTDASIVAVDAGNGVLSVAALGSVSLSASTAEGDGTTYCANSGNPIVISKVVNTYYLVMFDAQNGDDATEVKYYDGSEDIALPAAPTYAGYDFQGWFDAAEGGTQYTEAIEPAASMTVYAQWVAQCPGATITTQPVGASYLTGRTPAALVCEAEAGNNGTLSYEWFTCDDDQKTNPVAATATPSTAVAGTFYYFCKVMEAGCDVEAFSDVVTITVTDKDPICLIATTVTGATAHGDVTGFLGADRGGDADVNVSSSSYKMDKGKYIGVTLPDGYMFQEGDKVVINVKTVNQGVGFTLFDGKEGSHNLIIDTRDDNLVAAGANTVVLPAYAGSQSVYVMRENNDATGNLNSALDAIAVYRTSAPILNKVTVNGAEGKPNALKEVVFEVAASTSQSQLEAIAYDWVSNDDAWTSANAPVATNAWEFGVANTVTFTDKDGDESVYTITVNKAAASTNIELATLTVNGNAVTVVPGQYTYAYELPYGTSDVPAVVATAADANANVGAITVDINSATFTVTAEDGTTAQLYTINFSVSKWAEVVIWDGSTMSAVATSPDATTGFAWSVNGFSSITNYSATCGTKAYTKTLPSGGGASASRNVAFTVPAGYVAKFYIAFGTHSDGNNRGMFIGTTATKTLDETSVLTLYSDSRTNLTDGTSEIVGAGTYYLNPMESEDFYEIRAYVRPGYARTSMLGAGVYGTICVDHNVAVEDIQGATMYELMGREPEYGKLAFDEIVTGELEAGAPYVFQAQGDRMVLFYGNTKVDEPVDKGNGMYGTFTDQTLTDLDDVYYFAQRALWSCSDLTSLSLPANRAYVKLSEIDYLAPAQQNPAPGRRRVTMAVNGENTATGIENAGLINGENGVQKVLINGQLFILRGEKMYDATGRLVK